MKWVHRTLLAAGSAALLFLIIQVGPDALWRDAARLGFGVIPIVALAGVEHLLHALAWRKCFPPSSRLDWPGLLGAHLAGNAINLVTPTATLGGEVVRGGLIRRRATAGEIVASITIDRLAYALADVMPAVPGIALLLASSSLPLAARLPLALGVTLVVLGILIFFALQRNGNLVRLLSERGWVQKLPGEIGARLSALGRDADGQLASFHIDHSASFRGSIVLHLLGNLAGGAQFACLLWFAGESLAFTPILEVFLIVTALDLVSFFVPGRLGAQEGARMLATSVAGYGPELGLLFSLVQRVEQIVWTAMGLVIYPALAARAENPIEPIRES